MEHMPIWKWVASVAVVFFGGCSVAIWALFFVDREPEESAVVVSSEQNKSNEKAA